MSTVSEDRDAKVVFLNGLSPEIVDVVVSHTPEGFETTVLDGSAPEDQQMDVVEDADFLLVYRASLSDRVLSAAGGLRLVQLMSAGYDSMNLELMRELEVPCANNGGANSWAVSDHAVLLMLSVYKRLVLADGGDPRRPMERPHRRTQHLRDGR